MEVVRVGTISFWSAGEIGSKLMGPEPISLIQIRL